MDNRTQGENCQFCGAPLLFSTSNRNKGAPIICICRRREYFRNHQRARYAQSGKAYQAQRFQEKKEGLIAQRRERRRLQRTGDWEPRKRITTEQAVERIRAKNIDYRRRHPERIADYARKAAYGLPHGEYKRMVEEQKNLCYLCLRPMRRPHLDHSHTTGKIRKLLCGGCNVAVGKIELDSTWLPRVLDYLRIAGFARLN